MADEYIRRKDAAKLLGHIFGVDVVRRLHEVPTVDVAPVTRCKDCEHYDLGVCLKIYSDGNMHPEAWQSRRPTDFCSYGTPKNDGGETEK